MRVPEWKLSAESGKRPAQDRQQPARIGFCLSRQLSGIISSTSVTKPSKRYQEVIGKTRDKLFFGNRALKS